jgi:pilus assembly protein Flp/PilA
MESIKKFLKDEEGVTAIEYALIATGIAIAIIATVFGVGTIVNAKFQSIIDKLS